jgi:hypothetical protein
MKNNPYAATVIGLMPIMPKHYWEKRDPFKPSMEIAVGIGPYKLARPNRGARSPSGGTRPTGGSIIRSTAAATTSTWSATTTTATRSS